MKFVSENFGASKLAEQFGVTRYPAVFVNDILVARPRDFGFYGSGDTPGRYTPWRNANSQAKFKADLTRMVDLVLAGKRDEVARDAAAGASTAPDEIAALPKFSLTDLNGRALTPEQVKGRVVFVEFWATWCPPCRSTLEWLGTLKKKYGDHVAVLALAVESPEDKVKTEAAALDPAIHWAIADPATAREFGDIGAVPTMFVFDRSGKMAHAIYGAPPDLHEQAEKTVERLIKSE